jgi:hypothetical protein
LTKVLAARVIVKPATAARTRSDLRDVVINLLDYRGNACAGCRGEV